MPITYQQEFLTSCQADIEVLLKEHWKEVSPEYLLKLDPDWEIYSDLEMSGSLSIFTARFDGKLVGYFVAICHKDLHHKGHKFAYNDSLYLDKDYRKGLTGAKLIKFAEKCLKEDGVEALRVSTKRFKPFDKLLCWLGYTHEENTYTKFLRG